MDSIEAHRVKTVPGNPLIMRRAEEETANQCSNTKESTGAPVSASKQDSLTIGLLEGWYPANIDVHRSRRRAPGVLGESGRTA